MNRRWFGLFCSILFLAALAAFLTYGRNRIPLGLGFSWARWAEIISVARPSYLGLSVVLVFAAFAVRALRWRQLCNSVGACSFANVFSGTLMGFAGLVIFGRAGEPVRPLLIARQCRFPVSSMFGIWLLERLFDLAATAALLCSSLLWPSALLSTGDNMVWRVKFRIAGGLLLIALFALATFIAYFRLHGANAIEKRLRVWRTGVGWRRRVAFQFDGFSAGLQALRRPGDVLIAAFYSAVHWGLIALAYLIVAQSFGGRLAALDFRGAMLVLVFTLVGSSVQLPGVGGGNQVLTFVALTQVFRVADGPAAAAAIAMWMVNTLPICCVGVPLLIREGWSLAALRRLMRVEAEAEKAGAHISDASDSPSQSPIL